MESEKLEQHVRENQVQIWEKLMYVGLGSSVAILFHVREPLRDIILTVTLLYTTLSGFYLLWGSPWRTIRFTESRSRAIFGHLLASWLVTFAIFSYSRLPALGFVFAAYTILLLVIYVRTRRKLSTLEEMFP
jgi:hypothetical protein